MYNIISYNYQQLFISETQGQSNLYFTTCLATELLLFIKLKIYIHSLHSLVQIPILETT